MWKITAGSIPGSDHTMPGKPAWKNNQDAFFTHADEICTIGIVADGCGSGKASEVGANIGVKLFGESLKKEVPRAVVSGKPVNFGKLKSIVLGHISVLAQAMSESFSSAINDHFLFSVVGFVAYGNTVTVFYCGDGTYAINDTFVKLGPFPNNMPPYLAYDLFTETPTEITTVSYLARDVSSIMLGTDGTDFIPNFKERTASFLAEDIMFKNPDVLRRRLALLNHEKIHDGILTPGILRDDTTIVLARKEGS
jgi:hypothetical protein